MNSGVKFARGLAVPFKGFYLIIKSLKLIAYSVIPLWIVMGFAVGAAIWAWNNSFLLMNYLMAWVPGLQTLVDAVKIGEFSLFSAIVQGMFWVFALIFMSYFSYIILSIVGALFFSLLANNILVKKGLRPPGADNFFRWVLTTFKMIAISLFKLLFFICMAAALFVFSFLPIGMLLVPMVMCLMIAYDCMDFSFECMTFSIKSRWNFFYTHFPAFAGLGFIILVVGSIPGLFILSLPLFVAGAADLFADLHLNSTQLVTVETVGPA